MNLLEESLMLKLNYATEADLTNATEIDTSKLALKWNLANLKADLDKIDIKKLKTVPVDLSKLSSEVSNDIVIKLFMISYF